MMNTSCFSELYSHPDKYLEEHLVGCAELAEKFLGEAKVNLMDEELLSSLIKIVALCHDLGKSTSFFQEYLTSQDDNKKKDLKSKKETHHSLISAIIAYFAVKQEISGLDIDNDTKILLPFISYIAVKKHHGNLNDVVTEASLEDSDIEIMKSQLQSIDDIKFKILSDNLRKAGLNIDLNKTTVANNIEDIKNEMRSIRLYLRKIRQKEDLTYYILINYVFSLLIDADKSEVVIGKISSSYTELMDDAVDKYKSKIRYKDSKINVLRENAYREVNENEINVDERILSINLPTGLGKTLASISFALKLKKKLHDVYNKKFRIIYSLPYLSIIEQNYQEFEKILKTNNINVNTSVLLKHHHLSEVKYSDDETEFDTEKSKIMIEGWNSEIIVTTFIQLFHTFLSNRNSALRKFHRIANSIIILDEIQSIPFYYWKLVKEVLKAVAYKLNSYIIFVTATQPMIFDDNEVRQLTDKRRYFNQMNRVVIKPVFQKDMHLDELIDVFDLKDGRSYLFILNTISSARQFYQLLKEKLPDEEIIYMSTHVIPHERLERINLLKTKSIKYAVTTQLVEAGVDIDFDVVVRDLAPMDSINQSAGRCNRNWEKKGEVYVVSLIDEKNRKYALRIYNKVMLNITERILSEYEIISEKDFLDIIDRYYREISQNLSSKETIDILDAVFKLRYDSDDGMPSISKFKLIDDEYYKVDVFIEYNEEAIELWQRYIDLKKIKNLFKRRSIFDEFKADFYKYVISIPEKTENMPAEVEGFKYVNAASLKDYYDSETGFKTSDVLSIW